MNPVVNTTTRSADQRAAMHGSCAWSPLVAVSTA